MLIALEFQVVLSHSPFRQLAQDPVHRKPGYTLVVGPDRVKAVAQEYGFKNPILPDDVMRYRPDIWPFKRAPEVRCTIIV